MAAFASYLEFMCFESACTLHGLLTTAFCTNTPQLVIKVTVKDKLCSGKHLTRARVSLMVCPLKITFKTGMCFWNKHQHSTMDED